MINAQLNSLKELLDVNRSGGQDGSDVIKRIEQSDVRIEFDHV